MTTYKKLFIDLKNKDMHCVIAEIEKNLSNGWSRDFASEKKYLLDMRFRQFCFKLDYEQDEFLMWLSLQDGDLTTTNITTIDYQCLEPNDYNRVLNHFIDSVLQNKTPRPMVKNYFDWYTLAVNECESFSYSNDDDYV